MVDLVLYSILGFAALLPAPVVATFAANPRRVMHRFKFIARMALLTGLFLAALALAFTLLGGMDPKEIDPGIFLISLLGPPILTIVLEFFAARYTVYRLQDCGWNKWLALLLPIPLVNLVFVLILAFRKGLDPEDHPHPTTAASSWN